MNRFHNEKAIYIRQVAIRVINIEKSTKFYQDVFGFAVINKNKNEVEMGVDNRPLLVLKQAKSPKQISAAGLYHIAYLVPNRSDLANWLYYQLQNNARFEGASFHGVSEAIYLRDIDGNGIEVYTDTPVATWSWKGGKVKMVTEALDIDDLLSSITNPIPNLPDNTIIGHVHLSVLNLEASKNFYQMLGFNTVLEMKNAVFLSSQNYHHHLGMNVWNMNKAKKHLNTQSDIDYFVITYPGKEEIDQVLANLDNNKILYEKNNNYIKVIDVNGIEIHLVA